MCSYSGEKNKDFAVGAFVKSLEIGRTKNASENEAQNCCVAILCQKHAVTRFLGCAKIFGAPRGRIFDIIYFGSTTLPAHYIYICARVV